MKTPLQKLLDHLKDNNIHIWDAEERLADEEDFLFGFINRYHNSTTTKEQFYLNLSDYTNETR